MSLLLSSSSSTALEVAACCIWSDPFGNFVGQIGHVCGAALAVTGLALLLNNKCVVPWITVLFLGVYAVPKEFWWDETYETACERGSGLEDFLYYALGILVGDLIVAFSRIPGSLLPTLANETWRESFCCLSKGETDYPGAQTWCASCCCRCNGSGYDSFEMPA